MSSVKSPGGVKGGLREEIRGFSGSSVGDMGCCWGLWRFVRFLASNEGGVPGLRRSVRGSGLSGGLWGAYGVLLGKY